MDDGGQDGAVAVIFRSTRTGADEAGYAAAADAMDVAARAQPGSLGVDVARVERSYRWRRG